MRNKPQWTQRPPRALNYAEQSQDKFLNSTFQPDLTDFSFYKIPDNCVDDNLNLTIDGLGGGEYHASIRDNGTVYNGTLANFPNGFALPEIVPTSWPTILLLMMFTGIICFAHKRTWRFKKPQLGTRVRIFLNLRL